MPLQLQRDAAQPVALGAGDGRGAHGHAAVDLPEGVGVEALGDLFQRLGYVRLVATTTTVAALLKLGRISPMRFEANWRAGQAKKAA